MITNNPGNEYPSGETVTQISTSRVFYAGNMSEEFTLAPMRRLLKKAGDLRIGEGAAEELRRVIGEVGEKLATAAVENAVSDGRKTVLERDIKVARNKVLESDEK